MHEIEEAVKRSKVMSSIRSSGNKTTERRLLGALLNAWPHLACARPADVSLPERGIAIMLQGCFWHGCLRCYKPPRTRRDDWRDHMSDNRMRDLADHFELRRRGWRVVIVWECDMKTDEGLTETLRRLT